MRQVFFPTREAARAFPVGKYADMGKDAPKGARHARTISGLSGSAKERRKAFRIMLRNAAAA